MKRLTLDINERLEEEDYQEMLAQVCNKACLLLYYLKIYFYVCDNTFAFPITLLEHILTLACGVGQCRVHCLHNFSVCKLWLHLTLIVSFDFN